MNDTPIDRVRIFTRNGIPKAEFLANVSRSWALGEEGRASFDYAIRETDVVNEDNLQFGNYLLVENDKLPPWIGIIDTPREWEDDTVTVNAYGIERLFSYRRGATGEKKLTGTAGALFKAFIAKINESEPTILRAGEIWEGGEKRQTTLTPNTLDVSLSELTKRSNEEYYFRPVVIGGKLQVYADWTKRLGKNTPLILSQGNGGGNVQVPKMKDDIYIINSILGHGDGTSWESKPHFISRDLDSINRYGLREDATHYRGVTEKTTILSNNKDFLERNSTPKKIVTLTATNEGDTFKWLGIGNTCQVSIEKFGFGGFIGQTRILGMGVDPKEKNKASLVLEDI